MPRLTVPSPLGSSVSASEVAADVATQAEIDALAFGSLGLLVGLNDPRVTGVAAIGGAGLRVRGVRVIAQKAGTIRDMYYWGGTVVTGNARGMIYDVGATTSAVRTLVWDGGSVAPPGTSRWVSLGDPQLAVTAGQHLDFALQLDTAAAEYGYSAAFTNSGASSLANSLSTLVGGCAYKPAWQCTTPVSFAAPATISEAEAGNGANVPIIVARIV